MIPPLRDPIRPMPFAAAFICAPLLVTLLTCWMIVPVVALVFGGPVYLAVGLPVLLAITGRVDLTFGRFAMFGLLGLFCVCLPAAVYALMQVEPSRGTLEIISLYAVAGSIFAPIWAGTFAWLYAAYAKLNPNLTPVIERKANA